MKGIKTTYSDTILNVDDIQMQDENVIITRVVADDAILKDVVSYFGNNIIESLDIYDDNVLSYNMPLNKKCSDIKIENIFTDNKSKKLILFILSNPNFENKLKEIKIQQSKDDLALYIEEHPLISNCHNGTTATYSITEEKRNMFTSKFTSHTIKVQNGIKDEMTWNSTGNPCEVWTDEECINLICLWDSITTPLVSLQQNSENIIKTLTDIDQIRNYKVDYSSVDIRNKTKTE